MSEHCPTCGKRRGDPRSLRDAEEKAARRLGITPTELRVLAQQRWGRRFTEERDSRAPADANRQARAHVTRQMLAEMSDG